jgi:acyl dehydratase
MVDPQLRSWDEVEVGTALSERLFDVERSQLVRYAGASLDFNPIHWSDSAAQRAGLPDVIAHGMLTMGLAGRLATDWAGDPSAVRDFSVRFASTVPVAADGPTTLRVSGTVVEKLEGGRVVLELIVTSNERDVLRNVRAVLQLGTR